MRHDDDTSLGQLFPNGRGFIFPPAAPTQATVMGCVGTGCFFIPPGDPGHCPLGNGAVCNRISYFSDPDPDDTRPAGLQGAGAIGDSTHNNVAVAREQVASYAAFLDPSNNTPPFPSFTVSCSSLTCTFNGIGSFDYQTYVSKWFWDFGDGQTATGSSVSHTYTNAGTPRVHLVVTDSQGQTAVTWSTASLNIVAKQAQIVSQSVPTTMVAGQQYAVSVTVKNIGSLTWSPIGPQCGAYRLAQVGDAVWNPIRTEISPPPWRAVGR